MKTLRVLELLAAALCVAPWIVLAIVGPDLKAEDDGVLLEAAVHPCVEGPGTGVECDVNGTVLVIMYFLPATLVIIGAGLLARTALRFATDRLGRTRI
jgi:hypothetical protein